MGSGSSKQTYVVTKDATEKKDKSKKNKGKDTKRSQSNTASNVKGKQKQYQNTKERDEGEEPRRRKSSGDVNLEEQDGRYTGTYKTEWDVSSEIKPGTSIKKVEETSEHAVEKPKVNGNCYLLMPEFEKKFRKMVCAFLDEAKGNKELIMMDVTKMEEVDQPSEYGIIVPCKYASRVGSDVTAVFNQVGVKAWEHNVILLIFHLLPPNVNIITPSELILGGAIKRSTSLIVDVIYRRHDQIANCQHNNRAGQKLMAHLNLKVTADLSESSAGGVGKSWITKDRETSSLFTNVTTVDQNQVCCGESNYYAVACDVTDLDVANVGQRSNMVTTTMDNNYGKQVTDARRYNEYNAGECSDISEDSDTVNGRASYNITAKGDDIFEWETTNFGESTTDKGYVKPLPVEGEYEDICVGESKGNVTTTIYVLPDKHKTAKPLDTDKMLPLDNIVEFRNPF